MKTSMLPVSVFERDTVRLEFNSNLLKRGEYVSPLFGKVVDVDSREITVRISSKICLTFSAKTRKQIVAHGKTGGWFLAKVIPNG